MPFAWSFWVSHSAVMLSAEWAGNWVKTVSKNSRFRIEHWENSGPKWECEMGPREDRHWIVIFWYFVKFKLQYDKDLQSLQFVLMDVSKRSNIISGSFLISIANGKADRCWMIEILFELMNEDISLCNAVVRNLHMLIYLLYWLWIRINDEGHKARCIIHWTLGSISNNRKKPLLTMTINAMILNGTWFSFKIFAVIGCCDFLRQKNVNLGYFWWKVFRNFLCSVSGYKNFKENV